VKLAAASSTARTPGRRRLKLVSIRQSHKRIYKRPTLDWLFVDLDSGDTTRLFTTDSMGLSHTGPPSNARAITEALLGRPLATGEIVDTDNLIGREGRFPLILNSKGFLAYERSEGFDGS
jgi:hypothetical protein